MAKQSVAGKKDLASTKLLGHAVTQRLRLGYHTKCMLSSAALEVRCLHMLPQTLSDAAGGDTAHQESGSEGTAVCASQLTKQHPSSPPLFPSSHTRNAVSARASPCPASLSTRPPCTFN